MWLIPVIFVGALLVAASNKSPREEAPSRRPPQLPPPVPGPISVLGEFVRVGQMPPPPVILCAIAEAESIGRNDLASDIIRAFVAPVVFAHEMARNAQMPSTVTPMVTQMPQPLLSVQLPPLSPPAAHTRRHERGERRERTIPRAPRARSVRQSAPVAALPVTTRTAVDDEIRAMLSVDPQRFVEMVARGRVIEVPASAAYIKTQPDGPPTIELPVEAVREAARAADDVTAIGASAETVAQMQESAGLPQVADRTRSMALPSPLPGVSDFAWREFTMRLERESPAFSSSRHVGQYRQRRERLADLGIDPRSIQGSAEAQRKALDIDLVDAHRHAVDGDLIAEHLQRPILVPGHDEAQPLTLSGLLGVIQCAGLDGATGWLERPGDRKKYPNTTAAFLRTNGVF